MDNPQPHVVVTREPNGSWSATFAGLPGTSFSSNSAWIATMHLMEAAALKQCSIETVDRTEFAVR